ncbi:MAG TPA: GNAT family N-acetyltransferase [Bryobacteraceae bacterium]|nr:GNAT family N-acetyltransferase [Bryobacteraceae bacterium]
MAAYAARSIVKRISVRKTPVETSKTPTVASFWVEALAVERGAQGHGVGATLMRHCVETGFSQGFGTVYLAVEPMNHRAIALYEKLGWSRVTSNGRWNGRMKLTRHSGTALETAC